MELTSKNYHSNEANQFYMSNSQYKDFIDCEAAAMAKINRAFNEPPNDACLLGSYVHAWVEGTIDEFKAENPALFKQNGELYAKYENADIMISTLRNDPFIQFVLQGQKEVILTADLFGAPWKVKLDVYAPENSRFVDLKTVKEIRGKYWDKQYGYVSFVEAFKYVRQLAIYAEVERLHSGRDEWLETLIVAVSKEETPDKEIIGIDVERMQMELDMVEQHMPRILEVKAGIEEPKRCETCKYCRKTKKLKRIVHYLDLLEV